MNETAAALIVAADLGTFALHLHRNAGPAPPPPDAGEPARWYLTGGEQVCIRDNGEVEMRQATDLPDGPPFATRKFAVPDSAETRPFALTAADGWGLRDAWLVLESDRNLTGVGFRQGLQIHNRRDSAARGFAGRRSAYPGEAVFLFDGAAGGLVDAYVPTRSLDLADGETPYWDTRKPNGLVERLYRAVGHDSCPLCLGDLIPDPEADDEPPASVECGSCPAVFDVVAVDEQDRYHMHLRSLDFAADADDWVLVAGVPSEARVLGGLRMPGSDVFMRRSVLQARLEGQGVQDLFGGGVLWGAADADDNGNLHILDGTSGRLEAAVALGRACVDRADLPSGRDARLNHNDWEAQSGSDTLRYHPDLGLWVLGPDRVPTDDFISLHLDCDGNHSAVYVAERPYRGLADACRAVLEAAVSDRNETGTAREWTGTLVLAANNLHGEWSVEVCRAGPVADGSVRVLAPRDRLPQDRRLLVAFGHNAGERSAATEGMTEGMRSFTLGTTAYGPDRPGAAVAETETADGITHMGSALHPENVRGGLIWQDLHSGRSEHVAAADLHRADDWPPRLREPGLGAERMPQGGL